MNGAEIIGQQSQKQIIRSRDRQPQHKGSRFRPASAMKSISASRTHAVLDSSDLPIKSSSFHLSAELGFNLIQLATLLILTLFALSSE
jgi:hypothetical protein